MSNQIKIYCLFSIANEYDQPSNNLEVFWTNKPSIEMLLDHFGTTTTDNQSIVNIVELWKGCHVQILDCTYRIQVVEEGVVL